MPTEAPPDACSTDELAPGYEVCLPGTGRALFQVVGEPIGRGSFGEVYVVSLGEPDAEPTLALGHLSPVSHLRLTPCQAVVQRCARDPQDAADWKSSGLCHVSLNMQRAYLYLRRPCTHI